LPSRQIGNCATWASFHKETRLSRRICSTQPPKNQIHSPQGTQWTLMPPDNTCSSEEQGQGFPSGRLRTNATTVARKDTSPENAPNPRRRAPPGKNRTEQQKPHTKKGKREAQKKNRRESAALGNRTWQQLFKGETHCRTRPPIKDTNNPVRPGGENCGQSMDHRNQWERTEHHHPSG